MSTTSMRLPDKVAMEMLTVCESRYRQLCADGVDEQVAADRVFDAYECAYNDTEQHCFDSKDRLLENQLRTIVHQSKSE